MRKFRKDILNGNILTQILILFFPILLGYLFQQLYNTVDAIIVGRYVGKEALAAVGGTTGTTLDLLVSFIVSLAGGVTVIVAQHYGHKDYDAVSRSVRSGMSLAIVLGAFMTVIGIVFGPKLLKLLNVPEAVYSLAKNYIMIYFIGLIPSMIYNTGSSVLRAIGDSKRPLYFLVAACITNIILDLVFVKYLMLGVVGAAIATVISQFVSAILIIIVLKNSDDCYAFSYKDFGMEKDLVNKIVRIGLPSGIQSVVYSVSNLYINACVNSFGTDTMAAYTAYGKVDGMYWIFNASVGLAILTVVGQNYGAQKIDRVKKAVRVGLAFHIIVSAIISTTFCIFATPLVSLFTKDVNVISMGASIVFVIAPYWSLFAPIEIISSAHKACGDVMMPMILSAIFICGTRILYLTFVPFNEVNTALRCYGLSWLITAIAFIIYSIIKPLKKEKGII